MDHPVIDRVWQHIIGEARARVVLVAVVVGLLVLSSGGFVIGIDLGLSLAWIVVALGIALVAGLASAGLGPTIISLGLISLWWYIFPPLVGLLSGEWANGSRYTHPRRALFGYVTARAELLGGIEYGVKNGLLFAGIAGTMCYLLGTGIRWMGTRTKARR